MAERAEHVAPRRRLVVGDETLGEVAVELDLVWSSRRRPETLATDVVRDRDQPVERCPRPVAALERAVRVDERDLHHVLGVRSVAEHAHGVAIDLGRVAAIEALEGALRRQGRHRE